MVNSGQYVGYRYEMGFQINGSPIPDPSKFTGKVSDLDTMGKRDANGLLHRCRVATKHPLKMEYTNIPWSMIQFICSLMTGASFTFTYPDPAEGSKTITAYVGDRDWDVVNAAADREAIGSLKFSVIEYEERRRLSG